MNYKSILLNYITEADATKGSIVYQPCDGLIEVCNSEQTKQNLLNIVSNSEISVSTQFEDSAFQDLIAWSKDDMLLESSLGYMFCIPKNAMFAY